MVKISSKSKKRNSLGLASTHNLVARVVVAIGVVYFIATAGFALAKFDQELDEEEKQLLRHPTSITLEKQDPPSQEMTDSCFYKSLDDLSEEEIQPVEGQRHMKTPPIGGLLSLVCCQTTKGPLSIVAHHQWAPLGAQRFMEMVNTGYFNAGVPLMRCVKNFLCQFGLNADPEAKNLLSDKGRSMKDDPNWLPEGPTHRENSMGVKRFAKGYMAYAGAGKNSRGTQLIVALKDNGPLAGGSPWEVPWGELIGSHSYQTLSKIYTGYGEKGPPQGRLGKEGFSEAMKKEFPLLDHITSCHLVDERHQEEPLRELQLD